MQSEVIEGIVLQKTNYSESGIVLKLLTEKQGVKSFIFHGAKSKKQKGNLVSPLAVLSVTYFQRNENSLATIKEVDPAIIFRTIPFDPAKSSILFFMNEVLLQTVKEQEDNADLFHFLKSAVQILDLTTTDSNFPIKFLLQLTKFLGFYPKQNDGGKYFDLREGAFVKYLPNHPLYVNEQLSELIMQFAIATLEGNNDPLIDLTTRRKLISELINYYRIIFDNFKDLKSLSVLEATFHD